MTLRKDTNSVKIKSINLREPRSSLNAQYYVIFIMLRHYVVVVVVVENMNEIGAKQEPLKRARDRAFNKWRYGKEPLKKVRYRVYNQ